MKSLWKKKTPLQSRIAQIEAEMLNLRKEMKEASRARAQPLSSALPVYRERSANPSVSERAPRPVLDSAPVSMQRPPDERFKSYLASSFQTAHALKHERRLQRNKAIVMLVIVGVILFWVLWQLLT
jgi:hypothetical protein